MNGQGQQESPYFSSLFKRSRVNALLQMNTRGVVTAVNPAFTAYFGYDNADLLGKHFSLLFTEEDQVNRKPWKEIENVLERGQADDKNFMVHKNKQVSWVSGESILIDHEEGEKSVLKMIQDIHQQKDAEVSLNRVNDFNESILQVIDDFVVLMDPSLQVVKYNPSFLRIFFNNETPELTDFGTVIRPYDRDDRLLRKIMEVSQTGIAFNKELLEFMTPDGERVFEISCQPIYTKDLVSVLVLVGHDITVHKRAETEREDLMGFVVHELRNPLTSIRLTNDIMTMMLPGDNAELGSLLEKNKKYIERLTSMIAELYDAAKVGGS
jgi:PAS domain S-box-containing protein